MKRLNASHEHMMELQAQILMNAECAKKQKNRMDFLDEGVQQRAHGGRRLKLEVSNPRSSRP